MGIQFTYNIIHLKSSFLFGFSIRLLSAVINQFTQGPLLALHSLLSKAKVKSLSSVRLFVTPWTVAHQAPPSMGFSRQEYWSGVPLPSPVKVLSRAIYVATPNFKGQGDIVL